MRSAARRAAALWAVVAALLATVVPAAAAADAGEYAADRVVVVGVPGLVWADVDPEATPELWALAEESPVGATSVRAARSTTCVLDGWATLGAGNRARFPGPDEGLPPVPMPQVPLPDDEAGPQPAPGDGADDDGEDAQTGDGRDPPLDTSLSHCGLQERVAAVGLVDPQDTVERTAADEGTARFGAEPAALGDAVGCATVSGRAATLAVAAPGVDIIRADTLPTDPETLAGVLDECPLTLVSLEHLSDAGKPGAEKTDDGTDPLPRAQALTAIDEQLGRIRQAISAAPGDTLLLLAGISEVNDGRPQLHVGIASGPGFTATGWLTSASTGRAPFLQLIDLAPTALRALDLPAPASMNGQPLTVAGERPAVADAVAELDDVNTAATVHHRNVSTFFWLLVGVSAVLVALGIAVLGARRDRPPRAGGDGARALVRTLALVVASLPVATYLAGLVPWESTGSPVPAMVGAVVVAALVVATVAVAGPWRSHPLGPPLAIVVVTLATLVLDVLTGSTLELNGLLGYDAIVAGRFTGYGNLTAGLLSVSALLVTAAAATLAGRRAPAGRARAATAATVLGIGLVSVVIIGAPGLGRDFGGVLSALPGFLLLALLLTRTRVTVVRLGAIFATAVVAVGVVAYLDWLRPAAERSHLGRFVEQLLTGEAWTVVSRKAQANLDILLGSPLAWMLPVALVAAGWLVRPGGLLRTRPGPEDGEPVGPGGLPPGDTAAVRAGLLAGLLSLALGAAVNDSGVALPATAAALLVPLLVWLAAARGGGGTAQGEVADGTPRSGPVDGPDRVTVVSRGSTVWNA
ncbi:hypothetical protein GCM10010531_19320 [Blastococcus jejuensis]|uniref:Uncharacterized protein n=1 Tax=Blastococcus jejuensis TaxID=351224 RepID=A0ABP6P5G4_9ACTN